MITNLAIDLGNYNTKTSEGIIFPSKFTDEIQLEKDKEIMLDFDNKSYCIGKGKFDKEFNKTKKEYMPLLLAAIAKSTKEKEINLILGCPISQIELKDSLISDLLGEQFNFKFNSVSRSVLIRKVGVLAEGFSSFYTLPKHVRNGRVLIIDIGGRTVNVSSFIKGKTEKTITLPVGMMDFFDIVKEKENRKGNNYRLEEIESLIEDKRIYNIESEKEKFIKEVINDLKFHFNTKNYDIYFTGGGAITLRDIIETKIKRANIIENAIFSNVNGNKIIADNKWR